jgi:hypothetical protein
MKYIWAKKYNGFNLTIKLETEFDFFKSRAEEIDVNKCQ